MTDNIRGKLQLRGAYADELVAEIERMRAHNKVLSDNQHDYVRYCTRIHEQDAEIERLLGVCRDKTTLLKDAYADNERLQAHVAELSRVLNGIANRQDFADKVLAALEQKP